jgi:DNA-binding MarR family transcriptional regulator
VPDQDHVDGILAQWTRERPDVDLSGMAVIGRISRLERRIRPLLEVVYSQHGLESWEFDVLATLRRSGSPFRLTAGQLLESTMITSGAMTNRITRLEQRGLVRREPDPTDGRVVQVVLTAAGREVVDAAVTDHTANEATIVGTMSADERDSLEQLLRRLLVALDDAVKPPPAPS